jgi:excisionase family DNA binding protein
MTQKLSTAKDVADFLGITESTVYRLVKSGDIPGVRIGTQWRFDMDVLKERIRQGLVDKLGDDVNIEEKTQDTSHP